MTWKPKFVTRTIRQGRAKILGHWYYPDNKYLEYDGRLDGLRYIFGVYWNGDRREESFVSLWGPSDYPTTQQYGPELVEGFFPWVWWGTQEAERRAKET